MILDHIQLAMPAGAEAQARTFFVDILGMTEEQKPAPLDTRGGCWFRGADALIHVGVDPEFRPQQKAHPGLVVANLDGLAQQLRAAGYPVTWDDALADHRRFYTADPFGNRIEFLQDGDGFRQAVTVGDAEKADSIVRQLWAHFEARNWDAARTLLHADFTCHWPHTRERIVGRDNFIALNKNYPGDWHITIVRVIAAGRQVATEVIVDLDGQQEPAVSFFEVVQGKIVQLTEYWPQPYAPPPDDSTLGRAQWVERY